MYGDVCKYREKWPDIDQWIASFNVAFGAEDPDLVTYLLANLGDGLTRDDTHRLMTIFVTIIGEMKPRDHMERLLLCQMLLTNHIAFLETNDALKASNADRRQDALATATRMLRLYSQQMEALRRYRNAGTQTININHNHVHAQNAIVGTVNQ